MLLRQALEQTRAGAPAPVLFNSRRVVLQPIDEVSAMAHEEVFDLHFRPVHNRSTRVEIYSSLPQRQAAATGAQAS